MQINIVSTSNNLDMISKELRVNDFEFEILIKSRNKMIKLDINEYQLNLTLSCVQNCICSDLYEEQEINFNYSDKVVYPHAVAYIICQYR